MKFLVQFLQVGDNGVISFGSPFLFHRPSLFPTNIETIRHRFVVAPFWADVDSRRSGLIRYQVLDATKHSNATINEVSSYISQTVNESFSGLWMLVAEWQNVHPYPHGTVESAYTNKVSGFEYLIMGIPVVIHVYVF